MTREGVSRPVDWESCREAEEFGGPFWDLWKHSLLKHLGYEDFPNQEVEEILHKWWCLRMKLKLGIINQEECDITRDMLFPPAENDPLLDANSFISRAVRYIAEKTAPTINDGRK